MFNTFLPVAKPPTFGVSTQEVANLANKIRGSWSTPTPPLAPDLNAGQESSSQPSPAAPATHVR